MKLEAKAGVIASALKIAASVTERRNAIPVLGTVLFDGRKIRATDLDIEVEVALPAAKASGKAAIMAHPLLALVSRIAPDEDVTIAAGSTTGQATVTFSSGRYDLHCVAPADFPDFNLGAERASAALDPSFTRALQFAAPCLSREEIRYYLNGACIEASEIAATNGHQLASHRLGFDAAPFERAIIPTKTVHLLGKLPPRAVSLRQNVKAEFDCGGVTLRTRLIDDQFPDWRRIIPPPATGAPRISLDRKATLSALARVGGVVPRAYINLAFDAERLVAGAEVRGETAAREIVPGASMEGAIRPGEVSFNLAYLRTILRMFDGADQVSLWPDESGPALFRASDDAFAVIMPVRSGSDIASTTLTELARQAEDARAAA